MWRNYVTELQVCMEFMYFLLSDTTQLFSPLFDCSLTCHNYLSIYLWVICIPRAQKSNLTCSKHFCWHTSRFYLYFLDINTSFFLLFLYCPNLLIKSFEMSLVRKDHSQQNGPAYISYTVSLINFHACHEFIIDL